VSNGFCRTAFDNVHGHRIGDPRDIARNYVKSWFIIDFVSCFPVQYIGYVFESDNDVDNVKLLKSLRLLRLAKMLRIARLRRIIDK
jgi:hypothetical protein